MVLFSIETHDTPKARAFVKDTNKRLSSKDMIKNPFNGFVNTFKQEEKVLGTLFHVVVMRPLWPNLTPFIGFILTAFFMVFNAPPGMFIIPIIFLSLGVFWSEPFYYLMYVKGLKKSGYIGKVKRVNKASLLNRLVERL